MSDPKPLSERIRRCLDDSQNQFTAFWEDCLREALPIIEAAEREGVCEWEERHDPDADGLVVTSYPMTTTVMHQPIFDGCSDWKFCPYCGKPVEVKEG